jgi:hypothetical protein
MTSDPVPPILDRAPPSWAGSARGRSTTHRRSGGRAGEHKVASGRSDRDGVSGQHHSQKVAGRRG